MLVVPVPTADQQLATGPTATFHALTDMLTAAMPPVHAVAGAAGDVHFDDGGDNARAVSAGAGGLAVPDSDHDGAAPTRGDVWRIQPALGLTVDIPAVLSLLSTLTEPEHQPQHLPV